MSNQIDQILEGLVNQVLSVPPFMNLSEEGKVAARDKVTDYLVNAILDLTVDHLPDEAVLELQNLDPNSDEMSQKVMEYAASIPNFAQILEEKLNQEVENIKQNPSLVS